MIMKQKIHLYLVLILGLLLLYSYVVIKVILFKFGTVNFGLLGQGLSSLIENPDSLSKTMSYRSNIILLHTIKDSLEHPTSHNLINLFGNVAIFVPFGFLAGTMIKKYSFVFVMLLSFSFSLLLECAQIILRMGTFDVDDLLLNTSGGVIGYLLWKLCRVLIKREEPSESVNNQMDELKVNKSNQ